MGYTIVFLECRPAMGILRELPAVHLLWQGKTDRCKSWGLASVLWIAVATIATVLTVATVTTIDTKKAQPKLRPKNREFTG
ncbi:MAG: hypothetical protein VKJ85_00640 [Prochlorothrix sp.]|nr:hypothetical protein [Prochlorothrix sp.]